MNASEAKRIIDELLGISVGGAHVQRPVWSPSIIEALEFASQTLSGYSDRTKESIDRPRNAGAAWEEREDQQLRSEFVAGRSLTELAEAHGRTQGAIKSRLMRLGLLVLDNPILPAIQVPEEPSNSEVQAVEGASYQSRALLAKKNYPLGVRSTAVFQPPEIEVLKKYGFWLEALATERTPPTTAAQEQFVRVAKGELTPETVYERAWMRLVGRREIEPELAREFVLSDPGEAWFSREAHWRYHR